MNDNKILIGEKLAWARNLNRMKQSDVMQKVFDTKNPNQKNRISEIENGKKAPDAEILQQLCLLYGVSSDWVLGFTVEPEIDRNASRIGIVYNALYQNLLPIFQNMTEALATAGVQAMATLPKPCVLALVEKCKQIIRNELDKNNTSPEVMELMEIVRECDVLIAKQHNQNFKVLDDFLEHDQLDWKEYLAADANVKKFARIKTSKISGEQLSLAL